MNIRMSIRWIAPFALVSTLAAVGFASDDLDDGIDDGVQDRTAELVTDYWNWFPQRACNGDIQIHEGETTQVEECLIFDFANGGLSARAVSEDSDGDGIPDTPTDEFNVVAVEEDGNLVDGDGNLLCSTEWGDQVGSFKMRAKNGTVLYTLVGDLVFYGDVTIPLPVDGRWAELIDTQLAYQFEGDHVYDGLHWRSDSSILVTATAEIEKANPFRQLTIAAFVDGECGSPGAASY
jgi:hypothetical protein